MEFCDTPAEREKAALLRELLGGLPGAEAPLDGAIDGYRGISLDGAAYCVVCIKPIRSLTAETAGALRRTVLETTGLVLGSDTHAELGQDSGGLVLLLLESEKPDGLSTLKVRRFLNRLSVTLERDNDFETRVGAGSSCPACAYLPFSKAEAQRTMSRYVVSRTVQNVLDYISLNYSDPDLTNEQIARDSFLNYAYLCTQFHREMGITLNHYLRDFRMKTASELLMLPNWNILEVARTVGFTDVKYFSKCFKNTFGQTPNRYRAERRYQRTGVEELQTGVKDADSY